MKPKSLLACLVFMSGGALLAPPLPLQAEEMVFVTYYPAPTASYNRLSTSQNTYLATSPGASLGVGTASPAAGYKLDVAGDVKADVVKLSPKTVALLGAGQAGEIAYVSDGLDKHLYAHDGTAWRKVLFADEVQDQLVKNTFNTFLYTQDSMSNKLETMTPTEFQQAQNTIQTYIRDTYCNGTPCHGNVETEITNFNSNTQTKWNDLVDPTCTTAACKIDKRKDLMNEMNEKFRGIMTKCAVDHVNVSGKCPP